MLQLLTLICLFPQSGASDSRDEGIKSFLKRDDKDMVAWESLLWNNPNRVVTINDIMMSYKKHYNLDIAINFKAFDNDRQVRLGLTQPLKKIAAMDNVIPRGLALQLYLDNYKTDVTYVVEGGTIWIVPGKGMIEDESRYSNKAEDVGTILKTRPKYDTRLNKEGTNRIEIPPGDLQGAIRFFADQGKYRVFVRDRNIPLNTMNLSVKVPPYSDMSYEAILKNLLDQVNLKYVINSNAVVIMPK
ncbi:MAG TPA: hypothetical protein PLN21_06105 [Gemmatales bacterium]|nr:hypothetical protein [Gemmatales bacterium]